MQDAPLPDVTAPDRTGRLILFGLLAVLVGFGMMLLGAFYLAVPFLGVVPQDAIPWQSVAMGALTYGLIGMILVWAGVGSVRKRRWTRSVMLGLAWPWLLTGVLLLGLFAFMLDGLFAGSLSQGPAAPPEVLALAKILILSVLSIGGVLLPAVFIWVYRDRALLRTCERACPERGITDDCPTQVFGLSLGLALAALLALPMMLHPVVPVFGLVVVGLPGAVVTLGLAATCAALAYATLRVETRGWWGSMALMILLGASTAVTFAFGDPDVLFETLAPSGGQGSILAESAPLLVWGTIAITVMSILYMFMIRRHFPFDRR